jgi:hypothetical protein
LAYDVLQSLKAVEAVEAVGLKGDGWQLTKAEGGVE